MKIIEDAMVSNNKLHCSCFIIAPNAAIAVAVEQKINNESRPTSVAMY